MIAINLSLHDFHSILSYMESHRFVFPLWTATILNKKTLLYIFRRSMVAVGKEAYHLIFI